MNNSTITTDVIFDPAIHATDADGHPVMRKDGTFSLKRGRKVGTPNGVNVTRGKFDVEAVTGAYLAACMAKGDLAELTRVTMLKPAERLAFLTTTPEYKATVTDKIVSEAAAAIDAILDAAGVENYGAIMDRVRFGK